MTNNHREGFIGAHWGETPSYSGDARHTFTTRAHGDLRSAAVRTRKSIAELIQPKLYISQDVDTPPNRFRIHAYGCRVYTLQTKWSTVRAPETQHSEVVLPTPGVTPDVELGQLEGTLAQGQQTGNDLSASPGRHQNHGHAQMSNKSRYHIERRKIPRARRGIRGVTDPSRPPPGNLAALAPKQHNVAKHPLRDVFSSRLHSSTASVTRDRASGVARDAAEKYG
jgi:hypothetical protein